MNASRSILLNLVLVVAMFFAQEATSCRAQSRTAELDSVLTALHADSLFAGVVLIGQEGEAVYRRAMGQHGGRPLTSCTPLPLASVTKPLVATAVLSLAEARRLDLDAPVNRYLTDWSYADVTPRHLLNQTSGLHFLTTINAHADTTQPVTNRAVRALVATHQPQPAFEPGTEFRYDDANFLTLALVAEAVAGRSFANVLRERVLEPAAMDSARIQLGTDSDDWYRWLGPDGVSASAEDLLAFDRALRRGALLSDSMVQAAQTRPMLSDSTTSRYGFGWFIYDDPSMVGHFGDGMAAKTGIMRELETGTTYIILIPGDGIHRTAILDAVMKLWRGEPYTLPEKRPVAEVPEHVLKRYIGVYESGFGRLHITLENGQLHLEPEGAGGSEPLIPASETVFYFGHQDLSWEFVLDASGKVEGIMVEGQPQTMGTKTK